jgi:Zn-dependent oligopeptidase
MVGGPSATRAANLEVTSEALSTFQKRVDTVLQDLDASDGNPNKVNAQTIRQSSLHNASARAFPEAEDLYTSYNTVHAQLVTLSKTLKLQLEGIGIAVQGAHRGFDNLEEDQRRRFWAIQTEIDELNKPSDTKHVTDKRQGEF